MKRSLLGLISVLIVSVFTMSAGPGPENRMLDAVSKYTAQDFGGAVRILSGILESDPENDAAHYYMAMSKIALGETDVAEVYLERAAELDPHNFWYRYRLAAYYGITSRKEEAIGLYQQLLKEFPKKSQIYYDLFELYMGMQEPEKALEVLTSIEDVFGESDAIAMQRFKLLLMMERQEEAIKTLQDYNEKYSSPYVLTTLADYEMSIYNDQLAHKYYDEVLDLFPDYAPALLGKAEAYRLTRKDEQYFQLMNRFVSSRNITSAEKAGYLEALLNQSLPAYLKLEAPRLDSLFHQALEINPSDTLLLPLRGMLQLKIGNAERAEEAFRANRDLNPECISARATWCDFLSYNKRWEELAEEAHQSVVDFPKEAGFIDNEIFARYNLGQWPEIIGLCKEVITTFPGDTAKVVSAWSTMGDVYHMEGKSRDAFKAYEKALQINPDNNYVLNNYAYFLSLAHRKLKKAAAMSKKTVDAEPDNATYLDTYAWILYLQGKAEEAKPLFKHAMLYGGKESVVVMDHYAEVLYKLGEYDLAFVYWNRIRSMDYKKDLPDLEEKMARRSAQMKKKK